MVLELLSSSSHKDNSNVNCKKMCLLCFGHLLGPCHSTHPTPHSSDRHNTNGFNVKSEALNANGSDARTLVRTLVGFSFNTENNVLIFVCVKQINIK